MGLDSFCYVRVTDVYCDDRLPVRPTIKRGDELDFNELADECKNLARDLHCDIIESGYSETGEPDEFSVEIRTRDSEERMENIVVVFFEIVFNPQTVGKRDLRVALGF